MLVPDRDYSLFIDVDDENTAAEEGANPVGTLRMRYDAWKAEGGLEALGLGAPQEEGYNRRTSCVVVNFF